MTAYASRLTKLSVGAGVGPTKPVLASEVFTEISEVTNLTGPNPSKAEIDVTPLNSASKVFLSDTPDNGTLEFDINFDAGSTIHQQIVADAQAANRNRWWQIELADAGTTPTTISVEGEVNSISFSFSSGAANTASVTVRITSIMTTSYRT